MAKGRWEKYEELKKWIYEVLSGRLNKGGTTQAIVKELRKLGIRVSRDAVIPRLKELEEEGFVESYDFGRVKIGRYWRVK